MLLSVIKRRFPLAIVSVSLLMGLLCLTIQPRTAFAQSPSVTLNPSQGPPGTLVNATGNNWKPGDPMQVTWEDGSNLVSTMIDTNGNFLVSFNVPNTAKQGAHIINFTDVNNRFSLTATFTVQSRHILPRIYNSQELKAASGASSQMRHPRFLTLALNSYISPQNRSKFDPIGK